MKRGEKKSSLTLLTFQQKFSFLNNLLKSHDENFLSFHKSKSRARCDASVMSFPKATKTLTNLNKFSR